jgi:hypothetical protein
MRGIKNARKSLKINDGNLSNRQFLQGVRRGAKRDFPQNSRDAKGVLQPTNCVGFRMTTKGKKTKAKMPVPRDGRYITNVSGWRKPNAQRSAKKLPFSRGGISSGSGENR